MSDVLDDLHRGLPDQARIQREELDRLREAGVDLFPAGHPPRTSIAAVRRRYERLEAAQRTGERVGITGRVMLRRTGGRLCFATIRDASGELQVVLSPDELDIESFESWGTNIGLGDHVGVAGEVVTSQRGELSIVADNWSLTFACLRPLVGKHKGPIAPGAGAQLRLVVRRNLAMLRLATVKATTTIRSALLGTPRRRARQ